MPTHPHARVWLETASLTDVGRVRERNEDHCAELDVADGLHLLVLADGMGGHRGGATASRLACDSVCAFVADADPQSRADAEGLLVSAIRNANECVHRQAQEDPALSGMGTTLVAALISRGAASAGEAADSEVVVAHVGDSRAYRRRGDLLEALTEDHSVVAALVRQNILSEAEAAVHPRRNEILRSIGSESDVDVDVQTVELRGGDRLMLCSDGLCGVLEHSEIAEGVASGTPEAAVRQLVDAANRAGGPDNITVQIADLLR